MPESLENTLPLTAGPPAIKTTIKSYSIKVSTPDCRSEGTGSIPVRIVIENVV